MKAKVINEEAYLEALDLIEQLGDDPNFENDEKLIKQFNFLLKLVKDYEDKHYSLNIGDPIEIIKLKMNYMELKAKDLIPYIGSKGIVSEVLNKKRKLSKSMIRNLSDFLSIDQELLNVDYALNVNDLKVDKVINISLNSQFNTTVEFAQRVRNRRLLFNVCTVR